MLASQHQGGSVNGGLLLCRKRHPFDVEASFLGQFLETLQVVLVAQNVVNAILFQYGFDLIENRSRLQRFLGTLGLPSPLDILNNPLRGFKMADSEGECVLFERWVHRSDIGAINFPRRILMWNPIG